MLFDTFTTMHVQRRSQLANQQQALQVRFINQQLIQGTIRK